MEYIFWYCVFAYLTTVTYLGCSLLGNSQVKLKKLVDCFEDFEWSPESRIKYLISESSSKPESRNSGLGTSLDKKRTI